MRISARKILELLLAFLIMMNCNTVYQRLAFHNLRIEEMTALLSVLLLIFGFKYQKNAITGSFLLKLSAIYFCLIVYFIALTVISYKTSYVYHFLIFLPCIITYIYLSGGENRGIIIYGYFSDFVYYTSVLSSVLWFFMAIIPVLQPNVTATVEWGGIRSFPGFLGLCFLAQKEESFGLGLYRNTGLYTEAPMLSLVLSLALMYEVFLNHHKSKLRIAVLCLMIISTFSLTGAVMLLIITFFTYMDKIKKSKVNKLFYLFVLGVIVPVVFVFLAVILERKSLTSSYNTRFIDYLVGIRAFISNPVFGVGYNNLEQFMVYKEEFYRMAGIPFKNLGYSNGLLAIPGQGGVLLSTIYLLPFIYQLVKGKSRDCRKWIVSYLILLGFTIFHSRYISILFIAVAYSCLLSKRPLAEGIYGEDI